MPNFDIVKTSDVDLTFRNKSIIDTYELNIEKVRESFAGNIDIESKEWNVGLIVGRSGTGKTTIARECFGDYYFDGFEYDNQSVVDNMPKTKRLEEITKIFNSVGFGTVWSWLKPYHVLSNGEQMRINLARCILSDMSQVVFDEFTSVVDRTVAKAASFAISKAVKKLKKKFIAVSCHSDIIDWLEPDWIYNTDTQSFFFMINHKSDLKSTSPSMRQNILSGKYLESITI